MMYKDYNYLKRSDMCKLINVFIDYLEVKDIDPDSLFDYTEYTDNSDDIDSIESTYIDVYELVNDDTLFA